MYRTSNTRWGGGGGGAQTDLTSNSNSEWRRPNYYTSNNGTSNTQAAGGNAAGGKGSQRKPINRLTGQGTCMLCFTDHDSLYSWNHHVHLPTHITKVESYIAIAGYDSFNDNYGDLYIGAKSSLKPKVGASRLGGGTSLVRSLVNQDFSGGPKQQGKIDQAEVDRIFAKLSYDAKLNRFPQDTLKRYKEFIIRSGQKNFMSGKYNCTLCIFAANTQHDWAAHCVGLRHAMKCMDKLEMMKMDAYMRQYGDIPGPNLTHMSPSEAARVPYILKPGSQDFADKSSGQVASGNTKLVALLGKFVSQIKGGRAHDDQRDRIETTDMDIDSDMATAKIEVDYNHRQGLQSVGGSGGSGGLGDTKRSGATTFGLLKQLALNLKKGSAAGDKMSAATASSSQAGARQAWESARGSGPSYSTDGSAFSSGNRNSQGYAGRQDDSDSYAQKRQSYEGQRRGTDDLGWGDNRGDNQGTWGSGSQQQQEGWRDSKRGGATAAAASGMPSEQDLMRQLEPMVASGAIDPNLITDVLGSDMLKVLSSVDTDGIKGLFQMGPEALASRFGVNSSEMREAMQVIGKIMPGLEIPGARSDSQRGDQFARNRGRNLEEERRREREAERRRLEQERKQKEEQQREEQRRERERRQREDQLKKQKERDDQVQRQREVRQRQVEVRRRESERQETARQQEIARRQEELRRQQEMRRQEELRRHEEMQRQDEMRRQEEIRRQEEMRMRLEKEEEEMRRRQREEEMRRQQEEILRVRRQQEEMHKEQVRRQLEAEMLRQKEERERREREEEIERQRRRQEQELRERRMGEEQQREEETRRDPMASFTKTVEELTLQMDPEQREAIAMILMTMHRLEEMTGVGDIEVLEQMIGALGSLGSNTMSLMSRPETQQLINRLQEIFTGLDEPRGNKVRYVQELQELTHHPLFSTSELRQLFDILSLTPLLEHWTSPQMLSEYGLLPDSSNRGFQQHFDFQDQRQNGQGGRNESRGERNRHDRSERMRSGDYGVRGGRVDKGRDRRDLARPTRRR